MNVENKWKSSVREEDLMTPEELKAWQEYFAEKEGRDDPLELLGRNRGRNKKEIEMEGGGPDDGDSL
jgi:hypothetical protein